MTSERNRLRLPITIHYRPDLGLLGKWVIGIRSPLRPRGLRQRVLIRCEGVLDNESLALLRRLKDLSDEEWLEEAAVELLVVGGISNPEAWLRSEGKPRPTSPEPPAPNFDAEDVAVPLNHFEIQVLYDALAMFWPAALGTARREAWQSGREKLAEAARILSAGAYREMTAQAGVDVTSVDKAHQRTRNEAIAVIDTELQRVATACQESDSPPVRQSLARRASKLDGLIDRLVGWRSDA